MGGLSFSSEFSVAASKGTQESGPSSGLADFDWITTSDHDTLVSHYEAHIYDSGNNRVMTIYLGKPGTGNSVSVTVNLSGPLGNLAAGNYTIKVAAVNASGSTESVTSDSFVLPEVLGA
jgi:hypothetical protein